jgi:hypothetical protein
MLSLPGPRFAAMPGRAAHSRPEDVGNDEGEQRIRRSGDFDSVGVAHRKLASVHLGDRLARKVDDDKILRDLCRLAL